MAKTPAEILNETAAANAQKLNSTAAGASTQTGPLVSDPSLPAGFQKDATGRIFSVGSPVASPVVTSETGKTEFEKNKSSIEERMKALGIVTPGAAAADPNAAVNDPNAANKIDPKFNAETGRVEANTDPIGDQLSKWEKEQREKFDKESAQKRLDYESLFNTSLAAIDSATAATIQNIKQSYDKRVNEQRRINDLNISRSKAYGLAGPGTYTPISFSDAVSVREEEAAAKISSLENERTALLAQANAAAQSGKTALLRQHMDDIGKIEDQLNKNLQRVQQEAEKQYDVLRALRQKAEDDHKNLLDEAAKRFAAVASTFLGDYDGKDQSGKDAVIRQIMNTTGLDYATVFGQLEKASADAKTLAAKSAKDAQKETVTVKGVVYQKDYDADGNVTLKPVTGSPKVAGTGGGGTNPSGVKLTQAQKNEMIAKGLDPNRPDDVTAYNNDKYNKGSEPLLGYDAFLKDLGDKLGQSLDPNSKANKDEYEGYKQKHSALAAKKELTTTDKKKMRAQGLDPDDDDDVESYIKKEYDPLAS